MLVYYRNALDNYTPHILDMDDDWILSVPLTIPQDTEVSRELTNMHLFR